MMDKHTIIRNNTIIYSSIEKNKKSDSHLIILINVGAMRKQLLHS